MKWIWWAVSSVAIGLLFAMFWWRNPIRQIAKELTVDDVAESAALQISKLGNERARIAIEREYVATIKTFDLEQRKTMDSLRGDPVALAVWLTRISE